MEALRNAFKFFEVGHYVKIDNEYYRITGKDFLIYDYTHSSSVSAGGETSDIEISASEPKEGQIYGFLIAPINDVQVYLKQPSAVSRWGVKTSPLQPITLDISSPEDPNPATLVFTKENNPITLRFGNPTNTSLTPQVRFIGFKYSIEKVTDMDAVSRLMRLADEGKLPIIQFRGVSNQ